MQCTQRRMVRICTFSDIVTLRTGNIQYWYFVPKNIFLISIDATADDQRYGRLINHSRLEPNLRGKVATVNNVPRLYFVANKDIEVGTELQFDYGDRYEEG